MIHNLHWHVYMIQQFHDLSWNPKDWLQECDIGYQLLATTWRVWAMGYADGASSSSLSSSVVQSSRAPNAGALPHQLTNVTRKYKKHQETHDKAQYFQGFAVTLNVSQEETLYPLPIRRTPWNNICRGTCGTCGSNLPATGPYAEL